MPDAERLSTISEIEELKRQRDSANRAAAWMFERMRDNDDWCKRFVNALQRIGDATPDGARNIALAVLHDWHASNTFAEDEPDDLLPQGETE